MSVHTTRNRYDIAFLVISALLIGCGQQSSPESTETSSHQAGRTTPQAHDHGHEGNRQHGPHDVPLTEEDVAQLRRDTSNYAAAVAHIRSYRDTIRHETTEGVPAKAHRALDKADLVLERLPEIARDSGVPKKDWQTVNETAQRLRDLFNSIHADIDQHKQPDYAAVSDEIDQAVETLAAVEGEGTAPAGPEPESSDGDQSHE